MTSTVLQHRVTRATDRGRYLATVASVALPPIAASFAAVLGFLRLMPLPVEVDVTDVAAVEAAAAHLGTVRLIGFIAAVGTLAIILAFRAWRARARVAPVVEIDLTRDEPEVINRFLTPEDYDDEQRFGSGG